MKIVILTRLDSPFCYIVNNLSKDYEYHIIVEKKDNILYLFNKLGALIKKHGFITGSFEFIKMIFELPVIMKEGNKLANYLNSRFKVLQFNLTKNIYNIDNANSKNMIDIVNNIDPDIVLVLGTRILSKDIIEDLKKEDRILVNWHFGILPEYRGVRPEFYCVINNEIDMVGNTLHYLTDGINTGEIIDERKIDVNKLEDKSNYWYLRYENVLLAPEMINKFFENVIKKSIPIIKKDSKRSVLYSTPRKKDYIEYYNRKKS